MTTWYKEDTFWYNRIENILYVPSQSKPTSHYTVVRATSYLPWYCSCPAFKFDKRQYEDEPGERSCKHIQAVKQLDAEAT